MIAYGILGTTSNLDPDKTYDYHTAFDIHPTEVVYNVDINANNKKILNIALDRNTGNSAATVAMVKEIIPHTKNILYRKYFEEFYDFTDVNIYGINTSSSGVIINSLQPNITLPNLNISNIKKDGLSISGSKITFNPPNNISKYTFCIVFNFIRNQNFSITITKLIIKFYFYYIILMQTTN